MNAVRDQWTDERLDDLNHRVDEGFNRNEREFQAVRLEMQTEFQAVRADLGGQIAAVQRSVVVMTATMFIGFVTAIATILTQV